jgi:hypothetical protein
MSHISIHKDHEDRTHAERDRFPRAVSDNEKSRLAPPPDMARLLNPPKHVGLWKWLMVGSTLFVTHFGAAIGDVVGTSGLVASGGPAAVLGLWVIDACIALSAAGVVASFVDRVDRAVLARRVLIVFAGTALLFAVLVRGERPPWFAFAAVLCVERFQNAILYYVAWSLARDAFGSDVTRLARLRVLSTLGQFTGAGAASLAARHDLSRATLFVPLAMMFLLVNVVLGMGTKRVQLQGVSVRTGNSSIPPPVAFASLRPFGGSDEALAAPQSVVRRWISFLRASRQVRGLGLLGLLNGVGYTILAFEVMRLMSIADEGNADHLQQQFGLLRAVEPIAYVVAELFLAPRLAKRLGVMRVMGFTPFVLLFSVSGLIGFPTVLVGTLGSAFLQAGFGIEAPALSSTIASLPARIRGSIGVLLDSTPYTVGYVFGSALLGGVLLLQHVTSLSLAQGRVLSCAVGVSTSMVGVFAVRRLIQIADTTRSAEASSMRQ